MKMFEVEFFGLMPSRIMFAVNRQAIWKKYPGDVKKIHRIEIT